MTARAQWVRECPDCYTLWRIGPTSVDQLGSVRRESRLWLVRIVGIGKPITTSGKLATAKQFLEDVYGGRCDELEEALVAIDIPDSAYDREFSFDRMIKEAEDYDLGVFI